MRNRKPALTMPDLDCRPANLFPDQWAALPTHAKVLTALAVEAGLTVVYYDGEDTAKKGKVHLRGWLWGGTEEQFRACGLFNRGTNWAFEEWGWAWTSEGLRVDLLRTDDGGILAHHEFFDTIGPRSFDRFADLAMQDAAFQRFRAAALVPVPGLEVEPQEEPPKAPPPSEWGDWKGDIPCRITPMVRESYRQRGVFPMLVDGRTHTFYISRGLASAVEADAWERQRNARHGGQVHGWMRLRIALAAVLRGTEGAQ